MVLTRSYTIPNCCFINFHNALIKLVLVWTNRTAYSLFFTIITCICMEQTKMKIDTIAIYGIQQIHHISIQIDAPHHYIYYILKVISLVDNAFISNIKISNCVENYLFHSIVIF